MNIAITKVIDYSPLLSHVDDYARLAKCMPSDISFNYIEVTSPCVKGVRWQFRCLLSQARESSWISWL